MNFHTVLDFWFGLKQIDLKKGELAAWRYFESLSFDEVNTNLPRHFFLRQSCWNGTAILMAG